MNPQYDWQGPYTAAVLETDRSQLALRISQATGALSNRQRELQQDHMGTPEERAAIEDAVRCLEILGKEVP
jgi:hypothetical protein